MNEIFLFKIFVPTYMLTTASRQGGPKSFTHLGLWRKRYDCSVHKFTNFRQSPTGWLKLDRRTFRPPGWGGGNGTYGVWFSDSIARPWIPISSILTHNYLLPFLSYLAGSEAFPPASPTGCDDKYSSRSYI